jgi:hypothetical protein
MASLRVAEPPHDPLRLVWLFQGLNLLLFFFFFFFFFFFSFSFSLSFSFLLLLGVVELLQWAMWIHGSATPRPANEVAQPLLFSFFFFFF